eukprot:749681-Rhodomonas_salina.2
MSIRKQRERDAWSTRSPEKRMPRWSRLDHWQPGSVTVTVEESTFVRASPGDRGRESLRRAGESRGQGPSQCHCQAATRPDGPLPVAAVGPPEPAPVHIMMMIIMMMMIIHWQVDVDSESEVASLSVVGHTVRVPGPGQHGSMSR